MNADLQRRITELSEDRTAGASALATRAVVLLQQASTGDRDDIAAVARAVCLAQPSMGSIWNAAVAALKPEGPRALDALAERMRRAPRALARFAAAAIAPPGSTRAWRMATCSASASVQVCLEALHAERRLTVACAEGRPRFEGRVMAAALASRGMAVELFTDAAVAEALTDCEAVIVGADSIGPQWFINKVGTRQLAAAAVERGVPVFVAASRDKLLPPTLAAHVDLRQGVPSEVWDEAPSGVTVRNPYFERVPLSLVTLLITDIGLLGEADIPRACQAIHDESDIERALQLL